MKQNEKSIACNDAFNKLTEPKPKTRSLIDMGNCNTQRKKFQLDLFVTERPKKILDTIECYECKRNAELDGYRFQFVPICACCRTEREVQITNHRFERRMRKYE